MPSVGSGPVSRRVRVIVAWILVLSSCEPRNTPDVAKHDQAAQAECGERLGRRQNVSHAQNTEFAVLDLDCSGSTDSVAIRRDGPMSILVVRRDTFADSFQLGEEVKESLQAFADVDGDGILDVLLVESDESSIVPRVFTLKHGAVRELTFDLPYGLSSPALLRDLEHSEECVLRAMPRLERTGDSSVVVSIVLPSPPSLQCDGMVRRAFVAAGGRLRILPD